MELIKKAHGFGLWVTVVSNQSGLGRGDFSWTDYRKVHQKICQLLAAEGAWVDLTLCAPYYDGTEFKQAQARPHYRKPDIGMFRHAEEELGVSFENSIMIGDSATDLIPAYQCGVKKLYLMSSEKQDGELLKVVEFQRAQPSFRYQFIDNFSEVVF